MQISDQGEGTYTYICKKQYCEYCNLMHPTEIKEIDPEPIEVYRTEINHIDWAYARRRGKIITYKLPKKKAYNKV